MVKEMRRLPTETPVVVESRIKEKADGSVDFAMTEDGEIDVTKLPEGLLLDVFDVPTCLEIGDTYYDDEDRSREECTEHNFWMDGKKVEYGPLPDVEIVVEDPSVTARKNTPSPITQLRVAFNKINNIDDNTDIEALKKEVNNIRVLFGENHFKNVLEFNSISNSFCDHNKLQNFLSEM